MQEDPREYDERVLPDGGERRDDRETAGERRDEPDQDPEDWSTGSEESRRTEENRPRETDERSPPPDRPRDGRRRAEDRRRDGRSRRDDRQREDRPGEDRRRRDDRSRDDRPPGDRSRDDRRREDGPRDRRVRDPPRDRSRDRRPSNDRRARPSGRPAGSRGLRDRVPLIRGTVVGLLVYGLGYAITYGFYLSEESPMPDASMPEYVIVGWVFYNAHNVSLSYSLGSFNLLELGSAQINTVPKLAYYGAPAVLLVLAGFLLARSALGRGRGGDAADGAIAGAGVVVGYLALAVVGSLVVFNYQSQGFGGGAGIQPDLATSVILMGLAYPVILGGIGGALAATTASSRRAPAPR